MKRAYADVSFGQIHYQAEGNGPPLLMLHQTPSSSDMCLKVGAQLSRYFRVIAMDTPGYGRSDRPPHRFEMADYASTVKEFMDSMGIPKASLVGRATGACIAAELAVLYPDRADKLVFFGGPNYGISLRQARINTDDPAFRPVELKWDGSHVMTAWRAVATQAEANRQNTVDPGVTIEDVQMMFSNRMLAGKWAEDAHNAVWTYAVEKRLPLIQSHTLLLVGDRDFSYDQREETRALIPHCRIKVIPRGDLFTELTRSAEVAEAIIQFIGNPGV